MRSPAITLEQALAMRCDHAVVVRRSALKELAKPTVNRKAAAAVDAVIESLGDQSYKVRTEAANTLGKMKAFHDNPRIVEALVAASKDSTRSVVMAAMRALCKIDNIRGLDALPNVFKRTHSCAYERLLIAWVQSYGASAILPLIELADHPKPVARRRVLSILDTLEAPQRLEVFCRALKDVDHSVQQCAITRLSRLGDRRAVEPLVEILQGEDFDLPAVAARALARMLGKEAVGVLLLALDSHVAKTRAAVVYALKECCAGEAVVVAAVSELAADRNSEVRKAVLEFFTQHRVPPAREVFAALLADHDPLVRRHACNTLARNWEKNFLLDMVAAVESAAQTETNDDVRATMLRVLRTLGQRYARAANLAEILAATRREPVRS